MSVKERIIQNGIVLEKDWPNMSEEHILLATAILSYMESEECQEEEWSEYEQNKFNEEFYEIQDKFDLIDFDKVKEDKLKDFQSVSIKIPPGFAKMIQEEIFPLMRKEIE
jgi:hypothetical protein